MDQGSTKPDNDDKNWVSSYDGQEASTEIKRQNLIDILIVFNPSDAETENIRGDEGNILDGVVPENLKFGY